MGCGGEENGAPESPTASGCAPRADGAVTDRQLLRRLAAVAVPCYPTAMVTRCVGLCIAAMVGHLGSEEALAAVGLANVITNITGVSWLWGLSTGISTLSTQSWGAGSYHAVGVNMQRAYLILLCFADVPLALLWLSAEPLLVAAGQSPEVARLVGLYVKIRLPGIFFESLTCVVTRTLACMSNMKVNLIMSALTVSLNISLNVILVPRIGFVGAPIAVVVCDVVQAVGVCCLAWREPDFRKCWPGLTWEAWRGWRPYLRIALPSLLLLGIEWWTWDLQSFLAGYISPLAQATQAVTPQITDLQYGVGQSLSTAAGTVIGNLLGEGQGAAARRASRIIMLLTLLIMAAQAFLFVALRTRLPLVFTQDEAVISNILRLIPVTLAFSFLDSHQCALCGILVGAGKQAMAAPLIFCCYWVVGVPLGTALAFGALGEPRGLEGLWAGMLVAVSLHVLLFGAAVLRLDWPKLAEEVRERTLRERQEAEEAASLARGLVEGG